MGVISHEEINLNDRSGRIRDIDRRLWVSTSSCILYRVFNNRTFHLILYTTTSNIKPYQPLQQMSFPDQAKRNRWLLEGKRGRVLHQRVPATLPRSPIAEHGRLSRSGTDPRLQPVYVLQREKAFGRSWTAYCLTAVSDQ